MKSDPELLENDFTAEKSEEDDLNID